MRLSFFGASGEVTGSNILLETGSKKVLLDCGLFQGPKVFEEKNSLPFAFNPSEIHALVLCHAHLDHVGRIPKLVKDGFRGRIYSTGPTAELANLVLQDNQKLMREDAERGKAIAIYSLDDVHKAMELFVTVEYHERVEIAPGIKLTLVNAGHILGSAMAIVEAEGKRLVYTSDLGNSPSLLLDSPEVINSADFLISETTYGGRVHEDVGLRMDKLTTVINTTIAKGGVLLIPSFAIERTQELLHDIEHFCSITGCEKPTFYLDSPLAEKVTSVFKKYPEFLSTKLQNDHHDDDFFGLSRLNITSSVEQSKGIYKAPNPKVIIAGAGMMNGGRILYHAINYLPDGKNTLLIVGYQAEGSLGRRILEGDKTVRIFRKKVAVRANVSAIGSYSAHADAPQLLKFATNIKNLKRAFLVHGEVDQSQAFAKSLYDAIRVESTLPKIGEAYTL